MMRLLMTFTGLFLTTLLSAQFCSTPQEPLLERVDANKKVMNSFPRGAQKYIPITFHLVASASGSGRVTEEAVLTQVATLNAQYSDQEALFYIDRFNYFDNDAVYNTPASNPAKIQMRLRKDNNSVNIFITNMADSGNGGPGTTLAYYDPQEDWIVSRKNQIGTSTTIAHEIGHFFSLAHPHAGWDCHPFTLAEYTNPVNVNSTIACDGGGGSLLIELHDRTNCANAGDRICDTPEDYNLGLLHQPGCNQNTTIKDKNGEVIQPMVNNYMSYYQNCPTNAFTTTQKMVINADFFSIQRLYIRTGVVPNTTPVTGPVQYISPINGQESNGITNILLDWEDTPGATHYLVIYDRFQTFTFNPVKKIVTSSEALIEETLINGLTYYWRVWPFNESQTGAGYSPIQNFKVGSGVGVNEIHAIDEYALSPNPSSKNTSALFTISSSEMFSAHLSISDAFGRVLSKEQIYIPTGMSQYQIPMAGLPGGIYFVILNSDKGRLVERLLILE